MDIVFLVVTDVVALIVQVKLLVFNEENSILNIVNIRDLASEVVDFVFPESRCIRPRTIEQIIITPWISDLEKESSLRTIFVSDIVSINQSVSVFSCKTKRSVCFVSIDRGTTSISYHDPFLSISRVYSLPILQS
jgi:hypothetical protein